MAKSIKKEKKAAPVTAPKTKAFDFSKFNDQLSKIEGFETGSIFEYNTFSEVDECIGTGNFLLNAQFFGTLFGGIPNTRSVGFAGDPGSGKTYLCLNIVREAQKKGYYVFYVDTEGAVDREMSASFGVDNMLVRYQPIKTVSQFKTYVVNIIDMLKKEKEKNPESHPKFMIICDSIGMLTTDKEEKDALSGHNAQDMGLKAKELRSLFRSITLDLAEHKIPLVCTNHTGAGGMYEAKKASGGDGPIFAMSLLTFLSKSALKDGDTKTGIVVHSKMRKSRFTIPHEVQFHISFYHGMNPYVGLEEFITWDACGIERGYVMTEKEYAKEKTKNGVPFSYQSVDEHTGETTEENLIFVPQATAKTYAIKHLGSTISPKELFTSRVFTKDVLVQLDEKVIKPHFELPSMADEHDAVASLVEIDQDEEGEIATEEKN
jgi:recombination protein RecA